MKKNSVALLLFLFAFLFANAQKREISGKVFDKATNQPIEGVNIMIEKSKVGTSSKKDGTFTLSVKSNKVTLIVSCVGYASQLVPLDKGATNIDIALVAVATDNAEVVVVGYGTQKRSDVTGSITKFKSDKLDESPVSRLDQALQGKVAGLDVQNLSSESGAAPKVYIRGISSI